MSITYFCTDQDGNVYTRHSAGHREPRYTHAVVRRKIGDTAPASKSRVSYAGSLQLAHKNASDSYWPSYAREVVEVRAYPGRHKVEPVAQAA